MDSKFIGDSSVHSYDYLVGLEVTEVEGEAGDHDVWFHLSNGRKIHMCHSQSCCEEISLEEVDVDLSELKGVIKKFETTTLGCVDYSLTTFYNITIGDISFNMRWYGESNGYCSIDVDVILKEI